MHALGVLEFEAIREQLAHQCETPVGVALAQALVPAFEANAVRDSLAHTDEALRLLESDVPPSLVGIRDVRESLERARRGGDLGAVEIYRCGQALRTMREARAFVGARRDQAPRLARLADRMPEATAHERQILASIEADGEVLDAASPQLATARRRKAEAAGRIVERIQSYLTKHRDLLSDPIYTLRDGRYVIPLRAEHRGKIKGLVHDTSATGQTLFVEPEPVVQLGNALREAEAAEREEIRRILAMLSAAIGEIAFDAIQGVDAAARLDFEYAKARLAFEMKGRLPEIVGEAWIEIEDGRHPLLDREVAVPLTLRLGGDAPCLLITGPNTGGKTVAIKTVGLFVLMAQAGLALPAGRVRLGPFRQVWADIGDEQSLAQSLSTFSGHIKNIAAALRGLQPGALVLLDEVGAGTDPAEGAALARAILAHLRDHGAKVLASTHYGELKAFAYEAEGFTNAAMEFDVKTLRPTYRLLMGAPGASQGLRIAERYGIPKSVIEAASGGLSETERDVSRMLEELESSQRQARRAQGEADRLAARLRQLEAETESKLDEAKAAKRKASETARETVNAVLRDLRREAARIFEELKGSVDAKALEQARRAFREVDAEGEAFAASLEEEPAPTTVDRPLRKGDTVLVGGTGRMGTLLEDPSGKTAMVQMGPLKVAAPVADLRPVASAAPEPTPAKASGRHSASLQRSLGGSTELHLRAQRAEDAIQNLERFIDDALLGGLDQVRIVHGKGEGILRNLTREFLRKHPHVRSFRDGEAGEGGQGVTVVMFR